MIGGIVEQARVTRLSNKSKKLLKGVENAGFQEQELNNATNKHQSESELYFGDVSSCCGPESSLYDVATEKEGIFFCPQLYNYFFVFFFAISIRI